MADKNDKINDIEQIKSQILNEKKLQKELVKLKNVVQVTKDAQDNLFVVQRERHKDINEKGETIFKAGDKITGFFKDQNGKYSETMSRFYTSDGFDLLNKKDTMLSVERQKQIISNFEADIKRILESKDKKGYKAAQNEVFKKQVDPTYKINDKFYLAQVLDRTNQKIKNVTKQIDARNSPISSSDFQATLDNLNAFRLRLAEDVSGVVKSTISNQAQQANEIATSVLTIGNGSSGNPFVDVLSRTINDSTVKQVISKSQRDVNRTIKHYKGNQGRPMNSVIKEVTDSMRRTTGKKFNLDDYSFFDFESIGIQGDNNSFAPTQLAIEGAEGVKEYFFKIGKKQKAWLEEAFTKAKSGSKLNADEMRSLFSLAEISADDNGNLFATHGAYKGQGVITSDIISKARRGLASLQKYGKNSTEIKSIFDNVVNKGGKVLAGHNIRNFDTILAEMYGANSDNFANMLDTIELVKGNVALGSKRVAQDGTVKKLTGYDLDSLADFFDIDIDSSMRHVATGDIDLNKQMVNALKKHVIKSKMDKNSPKLQEPEEISVGMIGTAVRSYMKKLPNSIKSDANGKEVIRKDANGNIVSRLFDSLMFVKDHSYSYEGVSKVGKLDYAHFKDLETGQETHIQYRSIAELENILSSIMPDGFRKKDPNEISIDNTLGSMFGKNGTYILDALINGTKSPLQQSRINALKKDPVAFKKIQDFAQRVYGKLGNSSLTDSSKSLILESIGKKMNLKQNNTFGYKDIQDYIEEYSYGTVDSTKTAMRKILNKHKTGFEDYSDYESLIDFVDNWKQSDADFKTNKKKVWEFSQLMSNWLSPQYKAQYNTSTAGNASKVFGADGLDTVTDGYLDNLITNVRTQISSVQNKDGIVGTGKIVDNLIKQAEVLSSSNSSFANIRDVLTGEAFKKRLETLGLKNVSTGENTPYDLIEKLNDLAISKGVGLVNSLTSDGKVLKISAFDQNYKDHYMSVDENGQMKFDTSEMATFDIPLSDLTGLIKKDGMSASDLVTMKMGKDGEFVSESSTVKALNALIGYFDSASFSKNIKDPIHGEGSSVKKAESIGKMRVRDALDHMSNIGMYANPSVKDNYRSMIESGGTPEQAYVKTSAISMTPYLTQLLKKFYGDNSKPVNDYELKDLNDVFAISQFDRINGTNLMSKFIESDQHYDWLTKSDPNKYKMVLDYFSKAPFDPAYEGLKEEAISEQLYLTRGSHDVLPFIGLNTEDNRHNDQFFNYKNLSQAAIQDRQNELQKTPFKINGGVNLHNTDDGTNAAFNIGYATDEQIAKAYNAVIEEEFSNLTKKKQKLYKNAKQYGIEKYGLTPGTYNDSAIIGDAIKYFQRQAPERKIISENEISNQLKAHLGEKWFSFARSNIGTEFNIKENLNNIDLGAGVELGADRYLRSITKTDNGYEMLIENIRGALSGEKMLASTGERFTNQYNPIFKKMISLMADENSPYYVKGITDKTHMLLGLDGMIDENGNPLFGIPSKDVGGHLAGRLNYIVNDFLQLVKDNNIDDTTKEQAITNAFKAIEGTPLGNLMGYKNGEFLVGRKNRAKGFMSRWDDYNKAAFTGDEQDLVKLFDESGNGGFIGAFAKELYNGIGIKGQERYDSGRLMKSANVLVANDAEYAESIGLADQDYLDRKGRHRVGIREIDAVKRQFGEVRAMLSNNGISANVNDAEAHLNNYMSNNSPEMKDLVDFRDRLNQSINDTYLYNAQSTSQKTSFLENNKDNIIRIRGGLVDQTSLKDNEIVLSDLLNKIDRHGVSLTQEQYNAHVMGILRNKAQELGIDINKAKIMADLSDSGVLANFGMGQFADGTLSADKLMFALTNPDSFGDGVMPFSTDKNLLNLLNAWNERILNPNNIDAQKKFDASVNEYYNETYNAVNHKDSKLYKDANRVSLSHSGAAKLNSLNPYSQQDLQQRLLENNLNVTATDILENTMVLSQSQVRDMLSTNRHGDEKKVKKNLNKNIQNLKYQLQYLNGGQEDKSVYYDDNGNELTEFSLEEALIDNIIDKISVQGGRKSLFGLFNRYPSTSGTDKHFSHIKVDKMLANGKMKIGAGLQMMTNADSDGDMGYFATQVLSGDFAKYEDYENVMKQYELMSQLDDKVTLGLARRVFAKDPNKIKDFTSEDYDAALKAIGEGKDLSFAATLQSKSNKSKIGTLSNFGTAMRSILKNTNLDEIGSTDSNVQRNALITRAAFEAIEQDAISSKHVAKRLFSHSKQKLGSGASEEQVVDNIMSELSDFSQLLTMTDKAYKEQYGAEDKSLSSSDKNYGRINRIVDFGKKIGIFGEGADFLAKRQGWIAEERIKAITGKDFGPITEEDFINAFNEQDKVIRAKYNKSMFALQKEQKVNMGTAFANGNTPAMLLAQNVAKNAIKFGTPEEQRTLLKSFGGVANKEDIGNVKKPNLTPMGTENDRFKILNTTVSEHSELMNEAAQAELYKMQVSKQLGIELGTERGKIDEVAAAYDKFGQKPNVNKSINVTTTNDNINTEKYETIPMVKDKDGNWIRTVTDKKKDVISPTRVNQHVEEPYKNENNAKWQRDAEAGILDLNKLVEKNEATNVEALNFIKYLQSTKLGTLSHTAMEHMHEYEATLQKGEVFDSNKYIEWLKNNYATDFNYNYLRGVTYGEGDKKISAFEGFEEDLQNSILSGWNARHDDRVVPKDAKMLHELELGSEIIKTNSNGKKETVATGGIVDELMFAKGENNNYRLAIRDYKTGNLNPEAISNQLAMYTDLVQANLAKISSKYFLDDIQSFYANGNFDKAGLTTYLDNLGLGTLKIDNVGAEKIASEILPMLYQEGRLNFEQAVYDISPKNKGEWKLSSFKFGKDIPQTRSFTLANNEYNKISTKGLNAQEVGADSVITSDNYYGDTEQKQIDAYLEKNRQLRNEIVNLTKAYAELAIEEAKASKNGIIDDEKVKAANNKVVSIQNEIDRISAELDNPIFSESVKTKASTLLDAETKAEEAKISSDTVFAGKKNTAIDVFTNSVRDNVVSNILSKSGFTSSDSDSVLNPDDITKNEEVINAALEMMRMGNMIVDDNNNPLERNEVTKDLLLKRYFGQAGGAENILEPIFKASISDSFKKVSDIVAQMEQKVGQGEDISLGPNDYANIQQRLQTIRANVISYLQNLLKDVGGQVKLSDGRSVNAEGFVNQYLPVDENGRITAVDDVVKGATEAHNTKASNVRAQAMQAQYFVDLKKEQDFQLKLEDLRAKQRKQGVLGTSYYQEEINHLENQMRDFQNNRVIYNNDEFFRIKDGQISERGKLSNKDAQKKFNERNQRVTQDYALQRQEVQRINSQQQGLFSRFYNQLKGSMDYYLVSGMAYQISGKVMQSITTLISKIQELDKTFVDLQIVTGKTRAEVVEMVKGHSKLALQLGATTQEVNAAANEFYRMGYNDSDTAKLIESSMMLSKLGMIDSSKASEYMISSIKGYDVDPDKAVNIVDMASQLDMKYAVSAGYILEAMARTASSARMAGVEMGELQSLISIVGETTQKDASVVGESFKTAFARYGNLKSSAFLSTDLESLGDGENADEYTKVNDIEKVLTKIGINVREDDLKTWRSYSDILDEVGKKWGTYTDYEKNAITTAMFGTRQRENGIVALDNYNRVLEANNIASNSAGTSYAKMQKYQEGIEAANKRLTGSFEALTAKMNFSGTFIGVLDIMTALVTHAKAFSAIILPILVYFKAGAMIATIGKFANMLSDKTSGISSFGSAVFGNGITKSGKGLATASQGLWGNFKERLNSGLDVISKDAELRAQLKTQSEQRPFVDDELNNNKDGNLAQKRTANSVDEILQLLKTKLGIAGSDNDADGNENLNNRSVVEENYSTKKQVAQDKLRKIRENKTLLESNNGPELNKTKKEIAVLEDKYNKANEKYLATQSQMDDLNKQEESYKSDLNNKIGLLKSEGLLKDNQTYSDARYSLFEQREALLEQRKAIEAKKNGIHSKSKLAAIDNEIAEVDKNISKINSDISRITEVENINNKISELQGKKPKNLSALKGQRTKALNKLNTLKEKAASIEDTNSSEISKYNSQISNLERRIAHYDEVINGYQNLDNTGKFFANKREVLSQWHKAKSDYEIKQSKSNRKKLRKAYLNAKQYNPNFSLDDDAKNIEGYLGNLHYEEFAERYGDWKGWKKYYALRNDEYNKLQQQYGTHRKGLKKGIGFDDWKKMSKSQREELRNAYKLKKQAQEFGNLARQQREQNKSLAFNNIKSGVGYAMGMSGGYMLGGAIGKATGTETGQAIGNMVGMSIGTMLPMLTTTLGGTATLGIGAAIALVGGAINLFSEQAEKAISKLSDEVTKLEDALKQSQGAKDDVLRYDKLALGVSDTGKNLTLTDDEFNEFHELGNKLKDVFPSLIVRTDSFGNALLGAEGKVGGLSDAVDDIVKLMQQQVDQKYFDKKSTWLGANNTSLFEEEYDQLVKDSKDFKKEQKQFISKPDKIKVNDYAIYKNGLFAPTIISNDDNDVELANQLITKYTDKDGNIDNEKFVEKYNEYVKNQNESARKEFILQNLSPMYSKVLRNAEGYDNLSEASQSYAMDMLNTMDLSNDLAAGNFDDFRERVQDDIVGLISRSDVQEQLDILNNEHVKVEDADKAKENLRNIYKEHFEKNQNDFKEIAQSMGYDDITNVNATGAGEVIDKLIDPTGSIVTSEDIENKIAEKIDKSGANVSKEALIETMKSGDQEYLRAILEMEEVDFKHLVEAGIDSYDELVTYIDKTKPKTISDLGSSIQAMATTLGIVDPKALFVAYEQQNLDELLSSYESAGKITETQMQQYKKIIEDAAKASEKMGISVENLVDNYSDFLGMNIDGTTTRTSEQLRTESENLKKIQEDINDGDGKISQENAELLQQIAPTFSEFLGQDDGISKLNDAISMRLSNYDQGLKAVYFTEASDSSNLWDEFYKGTGFETAFSSYTDYKTKAGIFASTLEANDINSENWNSEVNKSKLQEQMLEYMTTTLKIEDVTVENFEEKFKDKVGNGLSWDQWLSLLFSTDVKNATIAEFDAKAKIFADLKFNNVDASNVQKALESAFNNASTKLNNLEGIRNALNNYTAKGYFTLDDYAAISTNEDIVREIGKNGVGYDGYYNVLNATTQTSANSLSQEFIRGAFKSAVSATNLTGQAQIDAKNTASGYITLLEDMKKQDLNGLKQRQKDYERALKDFEKTERDYKLQLEDFDKQENLNYLNNLISSQNIIIENNEKMISAISESITEVGSSNLDFGYDLLNEKMNMLVQNVDTLSSHYNTLSMQSHNTADETQALANALGESGTNIINNIKNLRSLRDEMTQLGVDAIDGLLNNITSISDAQNSYLERSSKRKTRYNDFLSNSYYTSGLTGSFLSQNVVDKQKSENKQLLQLHEYFNEQKLKLDKQYLVQLEKEQAEELARNREDAKTSFENTKEDFNTAWGDMTTSAKNKAIEIETAYDTAIENIKKLINGEEGSLQAALDSLGLDSSSQLYKDLKAYIDSLIGDNNKTLDDNDNYEFQGPILPIENSDAVKNFGGKSGACVHYARARAEEITGSGLFTSSFIPTDKNAYYGARSIGSNLNIGIESITKENLIAGSLIAMNNGKMRGPDGMPYGHVVVIEKYDPETDTLYYSDNVSNGKIKSMSWSDFKKENDITRILTKNNIGNKYGYTFQAAGTPKGNAQARYLGIAGENYKPEILIDKATGRTTYINEPTVIDLSKTDVVGEKQTASLPKFADGTDLANQLAEQIEIDIDLSEQYAEKLATIVSNNDRKTKEDAYNWANTIRDWANSDQAQKLLSDIRYNPDVERRTQASYIYDRFDADMYIESQKSQAKILEATLLEINTIIDEMTAQGLDATAYIDKAEDIISKIEEHTDNIEQKQDDIRKAIVASAQEKIDLTQADVDEKMHNIELGYTMGEDIYDTYNNIADNFAQTRKEIAVQILQMQEQFREQGIAEHKWILDEDYASLIEQDRTLEKNMQENIIQAVEYHLSHIDFKTQRLETARPEEWVKMGQISSYYDAMQNYETQRIIELRSFLETSQNLDEETRKQYIQELNDAIRKKHNLDVQELQDKLDLRNKQYEALTWQVNEYIDLIEEEKEDVSDRYDEEIKKLQKVNDSKERTIELTQLLDNLENARKEKKRVYRTGIGFVYESDREEVKKAQDELDKFYRNDRINDLENAKNAELEALDDRIDGWQKYLKALEDVYNTHERKQNEAILKDLLGVNTMAEVNEALFDDRDGYLLKYKQGIKDYVGDFTELFNSITGLKDNILNLNRTAIDVLDFDYKRNVPDTPNDDWQSFRDTYGIQDFQSILNTMSDEEIKSNYGVERRDIQAMHNAKQKAIDELIASDTDLSLILNGTNENNTVFTKDELKYIRKVKENKIAEVVENNDLDDIISGAKYNNTGLSTNTLKYARRLKNNQNIINSDGLSAINNGSFLPSLLANSTILNDSTVPMDESNIGSYQATSTNVIPNSEMEKVVINNSGDVITIGNMPFITTNDNVIANIKNIIDTAGKNVDIKTE